MRANAVTVQDPAAPPPPDRTVAPPSSNTPLKVTCPAQVVTSTPFDCTVTLAASDAPLAAGDALRVSVPPGLFHLANSANARFDADSRQLVLLLERAPGASYTFSLSLMADEAGAGRTRMLSASVAAGDNALERGRESARVEASDTIVVAPGEPVIVGAFESPRTPLTGTLLVLAAIVAAAWAIRTRRRSHDAAPARPFVDTPVTVSPGSRFRRQTTPASAAGASVIGAAVSLLLLFVCMPSCIESVRARTMFVETTCTIVDRGSSGLAPEIAYVPMAIVRYDAAGRERVASGFDVRGSLYGSNDPDASRLFTTGGRYPCWYDPAQPQRVILRQGPSATGWFALLPVATLALTLSALLGVWRR